jgi:hypothetical protein
MLIASFGLLSFPFHIRNYKNTWLYNLKLGRTGTWLNVTINKKKRRVTSSKLGRINESGYRTNAFYCGP